jgi:hypothetical protein
METIGIEIGKELVRIAQVTRKRKEFSFSLHEAPDVKLLDLSFSNKKLVSGLAISDLFLKSSILKLQKKSDLKQALPFQMRTLTSIPNKELLCFPQIVKQNSEGFHLVYLISTKQHVKEHLSHLLSFSLDPDLVSAHPIALSNFAQFHYPNLPSLFVLHFEPERVFSLFIENHRPIAAIEFALENISLGEKKTRKKKEEKKTFDIFIKEKIQHSFASFLKNQTEKFPLLLTGERELFFPKEDSFFSSYVSEILHAPEKESPFAIPIGLGLEGHSSYPLSFRQKELLSLKHFLSLGKRISFFLLCFLCFFSFLAFLANASLKKRSLLFDKKLHELALAENLKEESLLFCENRLRKEANDFAYPLKAQKVSSILHWLATHPIFGKKEEGKPLFELLNFHYEILEAPTLLDLKKPTCVIVKIEFICSQSSWARKFHESLLEDKNLLEKKEIEWEALVENRYKTSFYLKNLSPKELYDSKNL